MLTLDWKVLPADIAILRELAMRYREVCDSSRNRELHRRWYRHDACAGERPLLLTETDGGIRMVLPELQYRCREPWAQGQEHAFLDALMHVEVIGDDFPLDPYVTLGWGITCSDYGVPFQQTDPTTDGMRGAAHIDPVLTDFPRELDKLRPRSFAVDREAMLERQQVLSEVYDGILSVRPRHNPWWTMGLTGIAIHFIGLEGLMVYMYEEPEGLHQLMAFLRDEQMALLDWMEREELLLLNNESDYCGSGSRGYTHRLPQADWTPGQPVRTRDMWTLLESQETVGVGPDLYAEFIFPYENSIAERFGSVYYGCCEPVHTRWEVLKHMAHLQRVSVSPWCDEAFMAEALGKDFVYSRKPNPTLISTEIFDEAAIRDDFRTTLTLTKAHGNTVEIIMKDVHTLNGDPTRLTRWVALGRAVVDEVYGE